MRSCLPSPKRCRSSSPSVGEKSLGVVRVVLPLLTRGLVTLDEVFAGARDLDRVPAISIPFLCFGPGFLWPICSVRNPLPDAGSADAFVRLAREARSNLFSAAR